MPLSLSVNVPAEELATTGVPAAELGLHFGKHITTVAGSQSSM